MEAGKSTGRVFATKLLNGKVALLLVITVAVVVVFWLIDPNYLSSTNVLGILRIASFIGLLGLGVGLLLISGQIDLSTGAVAVFSAVLVAILMREGMAWPLAVLITILFGAVAGGLTAVLVNGLGMMAFIATIGLMSVWSGLALVLTRANPVMISNEGFWALASPRFFGTIPILFVILVALIILYGFILSKTKFGRSVYMVGGNKDAARLAGINPKKIQSILFINSGAISALCGILFASNFRRGDPAASAWGMDAITAAVLGGISFNGGAGGTGGFLVGLLLLNFFNNGLIAVGIGSYWQIFARGALLILALLLDFFRDKQRQKMLRAGAAEVAASKSH